jgi:small-conductance mechanosensitive channel
MFDSEKIADLFKSIDTEGILQAVLIIAGAWVSAALSQRLLKFLGEKFSSQSRHYLLASVPILRLAIIFTAIVLIVPILFEPTFENLFALFGALGIILGFAFKDYFSSLIAGIVILFEMPYRPGDWIEIEGQYGEVREIDMRHAEIVTPDDTVVTIPHLKLWNGLILNSNDGTRKLMCVTNFYLLPDHDAFKVKNALHDVALTSAYLQLQQPIEVVIQEKPHGTHYRIRAYPNDPRDQFLFITDLTVRGKSALMELGVEFAPIFPPPVNS